MAEETQLAHRVLTNLALPYITNASPTMTDPRFVAGSVDILTSIAGYAERRPGFSLNVERTPTAFNNLQRLFTWDRFDGTFIVMASDINGSGAATVYKYQVGSDTSFVQIFVEPTPTGVPFDFITSNNTVYFSNGTYVKKWTPDAQTLNPNLPNGVSNWGIAPYSATAAQSLYAGTGTDIGIGSTPATQGPFVWSAFSGTAWVFASGGGITEVEFPLANNNTSTALSLSGFGFTIPSTATINGIVLTINRDVNFTGTGPIIDAGIFLEKAGTAVGTDHSSATPWPRGTGNGQGLIAKTYGSSTDLWGTTWLPSDINAANFGFQLKASGTNITSAHANLFVYAAPQPTTIQVYYTTSAGSAWVSTSHITGAPDASYTTNTQSLVSPSTTPSLMDQIQATNYGFTVGAGSSITSVGVNVTGHIALNSGRLVSPALQCQLTVNGSVTGSSKILPFTSTGDVTLSFGGTDAWGAVLTGSLVNLTSFGVLITCIGSTTIHSGDAWNITFSLDAAQIVINSLGGPTVSLTSGSLAATIGYQYVICYYNSITGHVSSPSPVSNSTGPFGNAISTTTLASAGKSYAINDTGIVLTGNSAATYIINTVSGSGAVLTYTITSGGAAYAIANDVPTATGGAQPGGGSGFAINITGLSGDFNVQIPVVASTDPQVTKIRIFRTTDSASGLGGQAYFEIQNSPVPNTNATIVDSTPDASLNTLAIAPTPTFNDPPTPMRGLAYFAGRIWGFSGNKVYFTDLEECTLGVPEEAMVSGIAGNFWAFNEPVQAVETCGIGPNQAVTVFTGGYLYVIQGTTADTQDRFMISNRRGARNLVCVSQLGGMLAWLDSANQVWAFDGTNLNELSTLIRNDLNGITQSACSLTFHTAGRFHWLVLSTGTKLYVYDVDQDQWMPPWTFSATYVYSGEISPGNYVLMASNGHRALQLNPSDTAGSFNDNSVVYTPIMQMGMLSVVPDYGTRFSYIGVGSYNEPSRTGYPSTFQLTNNGQAITDFAICSDEDPTQATYTSIALNRQDTSVTYNRKNGTAMVQNVYPTNAPAARWIGMKITLATTDQVDNLYELFMAYKSLGGR